MGDCLALAQLGLPVKSWYSTTAHWASSSSNPNFAIIAEAVGIRGIRIEDPADIEPGVAAALVKAVMSGRADEVLDLAVTNLWRLTADRSGFSSAGCRSEQTD